MSTKKQIKQETEAAWKSAQSFNEVRAMSQAFMEQSQDGHFCVTPFHAGPLTADQCQYVDTLSRLQSYGIIPLRGVNPTGIYWEQIDGEYVHTRRLSDFLFLIRHGIGTGRFLDYIKGDKRLNKQVRDCVSDTNVCILTDTPTCIQRRAPSMEQLYKQLFTVTESACGVVRLEDCCLEGVGAITSAGVYICRVLLNIDRNDFLTQSDTSVAQMMQKLHLLQTIEYYARDTLSETENDYIPPPSSRNSKPHVLQRNISGAPDTATYYSDGVNINCLSNEVWYIIYTFLSPIGRWQLSKASRHTRAMHQHSPAQRRYDRLWATIFKDEIWVQKIRDQNLDVVLLTRDFDPLLQSMPSFGKEKRHDSKLEAGQKPYIVISITEATPSGRRRLSSDLLDVKLYLRGFISSLRPKNIDIKRLEVDFSAFTLNIMDVVQPDHHIYVPDECRMVQSWRIQALFYSASENIHVVEASPGATLGIIHGSESLDAYSFVPNIYGNRRFKQSVLEEVL
ncbi:hypothetical protein NLG97_g2262 [Lecanicillium saksenae]|uniref:Uncharacterized protein n=1 Tax=Lecanicillium saksenae TaxID=468837 RepID=A0ACC1R372_9HYPO|nr:hypothetical protein NLG97_g2262 [Lecanicillium saksenae]